MKKSLFERVVGGFKTRCLSILVCNQDNLPYIKWVLDFYETQSWFIAGAQHSSESIFFFLLAVLNEKKNIFARFKTWNIDVENFPYGYTMQFHETEFLG